MTHCQRLFSHFFAKTEKFLTGLHSFAGRKCALCTTKSAALYRRNGAACDQGGAWRAAILTKCCNLGEKSCVLRRRACARIPQIFKKTKGKTMRPAGLTRRGRACKRFVMVIYYMRAYMRKHATHQTAISRGKRGPVLPEGRRRHIYERI